jgi:3-hydroxybutyrate dehydrogenase
MISAGGGAIVLISTVNAAITNPLFGVYSVAKAGLNALTRSVALEYGRDGIRCNAIAPGTLPTPAIRGKIASMAAKAGESIESFTTDYLAARQPSGRFIGMESVGALVAFLCSAAAQDITGASLPIDGGWSIA